MTDSSDIAQRTAARLREHISSLAAVARERNATIVLMTDTNRLQSEAIAMRDSTIADLRELLEFKRKEITDLSIALQRYKDRDLDIASDL